MKHRIQYIILFIILAFAWSPSAWTQEGVTYNTVTEDYEVTINGTELQNMVGSGHTEGNVTFTMANASYESNGSCINLGSTGKGPLTRNITLATQTNYTLVSITSVTVRAVGYASSSLNTRYVQVGNGTATKVNDASVNPQRSDGNYTNVSSTSVSNPIVITCTGSRNTSHPFHINKVIVNYKLSHKEYLFNFSATANKNIAAAGTATASVANTQIQAAVGVTSASTTATFTATANSSYEFAGWGTTSSTTTYESTANPYNTTITNNSAGSTASKTLYAIFKPFFNFSFATSVINSSCGSANVTYSAKVNGAPGATSVSTQPTFTASANTGCVFEGWYYDSDHTNLASTSASYTPTIVSGAPGSTTNLTLYAWFRRTQTLEWTNAYDRNVVVETTRVGAATATASSGLTVTYSSDRESIATVNESGDVYGVAASVTQEATITATQAGDNEYHPVSATRVFRVITKYQAEYEPSGFTGTAPIIHVGDEPTITVQYVDEEFEYSSSDESVVAIDMEDGVIMLTALKVGTSVVTLRQPGNYTHNEVRTKYNIRVDKVPNSLEVYPFALSKQVDDTIHVTFLHRINTVTPIIAEISKDTLSSEINNGTDVITYENGVITAHNAGVATITFSQAATDMYAGFTSSPYRVVVTKHSNPISITLAGGSSTNIKLKYNATASLSFESENDSSTPTVSPANNTYSTYSNGTITAGSVQGTDIYHITQAETYKYEAGNATFIIRVNNTDEATMYVLEDNSEHSIFTINNYTPAALSGPGDVLSFDARRQTAAANYFYVMYSTDNGASYQELANPSLTTDYKNYSYSLPDGVTNIRFETRLGATLNKYVKNIKVSRKTYVEASTSDATSLGTVYTDETRTLTFTVNYSTTNGGNISLNSSNDNFELSTTELTTATNSDGTKSFTVTYTPNPTSLGDESSVITIQDLFYSQTFTLTATAAKRANTLAVIGNQDLKVGDEVAGVYTGKNSNGLFSYSLSKSGVITYNANDNKITAIGEGEVTLTFTQLENNVYYGATKSVKVNVSKYDQTIFWDNDLTEEDFYLEVGDVFDENTASTNSDSGLDITYSSSNPSALNVDESTGVLTALDGSPSVVITATLAGNYMYNEAKITREFVVIKKENVKVTTNPTLSESETNLFPIANPDITIRCNALIASASALSVSGDAGTISYTFASNTFTLHAEKEGTVTVTLTRAADESYYALSKTYTIEVVKPALVLEPSEAPVISYEVYSSVTLQRTLKAGYSTIALPFDTDVETIVGDSYDEDEDWVAQLSAVTSSVADGYTLYFQKVADGAIEANKPYVLHLASAKVNPTWTDLEDGISVDEASPASIHPTKGYSGYAGWTMTANYTPDFAMDGKYGVVNSEGGLMLGSGSGAKLNAFAAYITAPSGPSNAPRLRVAYVDEDGTTTYIDSLFEGQQEKAPEAIYGPDGQRRAKMQRGVNIVRYSDGTTRKVYQ